MAYSLNIIWCIGSSLAVLLSDFYRPGQSAFHMPHLSALNFIFILRQNTMSSIL